MKQITAVLLVALIILTSAPDLSACGDKLLHLNRLHRAKTKPASVVVFYRPDSLLGGTSPERLNKAFEEAGHKLILVTTDRDLRAALQAGVAEVLIADLQDAASLPGGMSGPPSVVAVVAKSDRQGLSSAKIFDAILKAPAKPDNYLDAVDRALEARLAKRTKLAQQPLITR
jgi:hypothetical protein